MNDTTKMLDSDGSNMNNTHRTEDSSVAEGNVKNVNDKCTQDEKKTNYRTEAQQGSKEIKLGEKKKWLLEAAGWQENNQLTEMLLQFQEAFNYEGRSLRTVEMMKQLVRLCCSEKELEERIFALETDYIQHTQISGGCLLSGYESFVSTKQGDATGRSQKTKQPFLQETSKDRLFSLTSVTSPLCEQEKLKTWNCFLMSSVVSDEKRKESELGKKSDADAYSEETTAVSKQSGGKVTKSLVHKHIKNISKYNHKRNGGATSRVNNHHCRTSSVLTPTDKIIADSRNQGKNVKMQCENADGKVKTTASHTSVYNEKKENASKSELPVKEECRASSVVSKEKHVADKINKNFLKKEKFHSSNNGAANQSYNSNRSSSDVIMPKLNRPQPASSDHNEENASNASGNLSTNKVKRHRRKL